MTKKGKYQKKIIKYLFLLSIFIIFYCFLVAFASFTASFSHADNFYFAKIQKEGVYFYSNPIDSSENILFEVPNTYFVKLLDDENSLFYYAQYSDQFGYVKKSDVIAMDGTPQNPYATSSFRIFALEGMGLYSSPSLSAENEIAEIPYLTDDLVYYGKVSGQQAIPDKSNEWYYCKYTSSDTLYGYVYSVFCDKLTDFADNYETFAIVTSPTFSSSSNLDGLSTVAMTFIVIGVSIPCVIVIYLLVKPTLFKEKAINEHTKIPKKRRHGDYYEFDESDLN